MRNEAEVYVVQAKFLEYVQNAVQDGWEKTIKRQTKWGHSHWDLARYRLLLDGLSAAHSEAVIEGTTAVRARALGLFRKKVSEYPDLRYNSFLKPEPAFCVLEDLERMKPKEDVEQTLRSIFQEKVESNNIDKCIAEFHKVMDRAEQSIEGGSEHNVSRNMREVVTAQNCFYAFVNRRQKSKFVDWDLRRLTDKLVWKTLLSRLYSRKRYLTVQSFLQSPELTTRTELRQIFQTLSADRRDQERPYHCALILGQGAFSRSHNPYSGWHDIFALNSWTKEPRDMRPHVLGSISVMPDKESYKTMILAQESQSDSHPVFDCRGIVRYPHHNSP